MQQRTLNLNIRTITDYMPLASLHTLPEEFFLGIVQQNNPDVGDLVNPSRFDGFSLNYCSYGRIEITSNLKTFEIGPGMCYIYVPGNIISMRILEYPASVGVVAASQSFISELHFDFARLYEESFSILDNPVIKLDDETINVGRGYYSLIKSLLESGLNDTKSILKPVFSSMFMLIGSVLNSRLNSRTLDEKVTNRARRIFENFIKLVSENHTKERYLDFYADKLCLTPKYLSSVVKEVSGKSAPEWIDSYVILEAKNMLKYSDMGIKEITMKLNFLAPSVFCRFFKAQTGMTPTEYRNS